MNVAAPNVIQFSSESEWLAWRNDPAAGRIGGSEIASALGHSRYESRYTFFQRKRGLLPPKTETIAMRRGKALEPLVASLYEEVTGRVLRDPGHFTVFVHPEHDWLFVTPDRLIFDTGAPVELKTKRDTAIRQWREEGPDLEHQCQHQMQMACLDQEAGSIAGLCGDQFEYFDFERSDRFIRAALPRLAEMHERILNGDAPDVDGSESTTETLRALHPKDNGETVVIPELAEWGAELEALQSHAKEVAEQIDAYKNRIKERIGDATFGVCGAVKYSFKTVSNSFKTVSKKEYVVKASEYRTLRKCS